MSGGFEHLAAQHTVGDDGVPDRVVALAAGGEPVLEWRNELGGLTFAVGDRFIKWNPRTTGIDLRREQVRLAWLSGRHPVPQVLEAGEDDDEQWLVTTRIVGESAVGDRWRARRREAICAIAGGLRAMHALPLDVVSSDATCDSWVGRTPSVLGPRPDLVDPVVVHGDACAPNTLVDDAGAWVGHVDVGDLAVGDRWADLAVASLSLDWNFGAGHQGALFEAYGIEPDPVRIAYYRALWELES